jgi:hypothetical protein
MEPSMSDAIQTRKPKANRLADKIQAGLAGRAANPVVVRVSLVGQAAETWAELKKDAERLKMDDLALMVALLDAGSASLRKALRGIATPQ